MYLVCLTLVKYHHCKMVLIAVRNRILGRWNRPRLQQMDVVDRRGVISINFDVLSTF